MDVPNLIPYEWQIQVAQLLTNWANELEDCARKQNKPHMLYKPRLYKDGNCWFALLGENLMEGVVGMGDCPGEAMLNFDNAWDKKAAPAKAEQATNAQQAATRLEPETQIENSTPPVLDPNGGKI